MESHHEGMKFSLYSSFLKGNAKVPQMPETSLRLRKLLESEHASLEQVTRLLYSNPPLAAYLLQFASSPMLRNVRQGVNLQEIVSRIGMQRVNNLVLTFAVEHLFTSQDPALLKVFRARWNAALMCGAYCACLAQQYTRLQMEDAMLGGLLQDIGSLPLLDELERWPDVPREPNELQQLCDQLSADIGVIVLTAWRLPTMLIDCARYRASWDRAHVGPTDLVDVLQVAQLLSGGADNDVQLVQTPAWKRLLGARVDELPPQAIRDEVGSEVAFWFKLLGGKG